MRRLPLIAVGMLFAVLLRANAQDTQAGWIVDDFDAGELKSGWTIATGTWTPGDGKVVSGGSAEYATLINSLYLLRSKPYTIECAFTGAGGVAFSLEHPDKLATGHIVVLTGSTISTGFIDIVGKYHETRAVDYIAPQGESRIRVHVDPIKKQYTVTVGEREIGVEVLRSLSGYAGLCATKPGVRYDFFQVLGEGRPQSPSFFLKSNTRQLDHLSYMALMDESIVAVNPVVGMIQKITSTGSYVYEIAMQGQNVKPRGVCVDDNTIYAVDGGTGAVRVFNSQLQLERIISTDMKDPRGVAILNGKILVVDAEGLKMFEKNGTFMGAKAKGLFKDARNIFVSGGKVYVADFGAGLVQVLDGSLNVETSFKDRMVNPFDVCVDEKAGEIYVADPGLGAVLLYDLKGALIDVIEPITINGFISPRAVRVRGNMLYVGDYDRILGFKKDALSIRPQLRID